MGLLSFFQRKSSASSDTPSDAAPGSIQAARTRARRRLIGAVVLLGIGVIGFPLLFESQPRPIPVDIPIDIPARDATSALKAPASQPSAAAASRKPAPLVPAVIDESPIEVEAAPAPARAATPASTPARVAATPPKPAPTAAVKPAPPPAASAAATEPAPVKPDAGRFVVQVGAFAEADKAREARTKVEGLGLKTYTQVVDTPAGKRTRVRVGPYASRDEADKAASRIKGGGLPAAILEL